MTTRYNADTITELEAHFIARNDALNRLGNLVSTYLALPGLRGFWPMSAYDSSGNTFDQSANGRTLTYNGNPTYNYANLVPYINLDGTGDYLSRADEAGLDITGAETYVGNPGLTMGCWVNLDSSAGTQVVMSKFSTSAGNFSYEIGWIDPDGYLFEVSVDGTALTFFTYVSDTDKWRFFVVRFTPSTEMKMWLDNETSVFTTSIPASIFSGNADFDIGARNGTILLTGQVSMAFLCASALSDAHIFGLFEQSRVLYGI